MGVIGQLLRAPAVLSESKHHGLKSVAEAVLFKLLQEKKAFKQGHSFSDRRWNSLLVCIFSPDMIILSHTSFCCIFTKSHWFKHGLGGRRMFSRVIALVESWAVLRSCGKTYNLLNTLWFSLLWGNVSASGFWAQAASSFKGVVPDLLPKMFCCPEFCVCGQVHTHTHTQYFCIPSSTWKERKGCFLVVIWGSSVGETGSYTPLPLRSIGFLLENEVTQKHSRADLLCFISSALLVAECYLQPAMDWRGYQAEISTFSAYTSLASCLIDKVQVFLGGSIGKTEIDVFAPMVPAEK